MHITKVPDINDENEVADFAAWWLQYETTLPESAVKAYLDDLVKHIRYVIEAGRRLGVPEFQLQHHDESKFSVEEFPAAVERFKAGDPNPDRYAAAWLNHVHKNPHHWQHWMFPDGFTPRGSSAEAGVMAMPEEYVREMVADWMGSSMAYTGSWDMTKWLVDNMGRIRLHSRTAAAVRGVLAELGYSDDVLATPWAQEKKGDG